LRAGDPNQEEAGCTKYLQELKLRNSIAGQMLHPKNSKPWELSIVQEPPDQHSQDHKEMVLFLFVISLKPSKGVSTSYIHCIILALASFDHCEIMNLMVMDSNELLPFDPGR
jgi:hypothetical protein